MSGPLKIAYTIPPGAQFGAPRAGGRHHQGTDYHAPIGTPIYATGNGRVVSNVGETGVGIGFGNYVSIAYEGGRVTLDGHLRERSRLAVGALVTSSTIVAYLGMSGNAIYSDPPGPHDHHQVWINGVLVDPVAYYGALVVADSESPVVIPSTPKARKRMDIIQNSASQLSVLLPQHDGTVARHPLSLAEWTALDAKGYGYVKVADSFYAEFRVV